MARTRKKQTEGLGDTIENVLEVTGIAKVAKWVLGEDCGCDERKEKLNKLFSYHRPKCLTEEEFTYFNETNVLEQGTFKPSEQREILKIYNRVFSQNKQPSSCGSCFREVINSLTLVIKEYKEEKDV
jgi:hypothetical protein